MRNSTLLFLVRRTDGKITDICLAMKKRGFGVGRWNGVGGKVDAEESIEEAAIRETKEEIGVTVSVLEKVGEIAFSFALTPDWNQMVHVYMQTRGKGSRLRVKRWRHSGTVSKISLTQICGQMIFTGYHKCSLVKKYKPHLPSVKKTAF